MNLRASALLLGLLGLLTPIGAVADVLVEIEHPDPGETEPVGFQLSGDQEVRIEAVLLGSNEILGTLTAAWILDARSREVVWSETPPSTEGQSLDEVSDEIRLGAGTYEAYFATYSKLEEIGDEEDGWWKKAARALGRKIFGWEDYEELLEKVRFRIEGDGERVGENEIEEIREGRREEALVSLHATEDRYSEESAFLLERPTELEIYAIGELTGEGAYDYGWIVDAQTHHKVWTFELEDSEEAGGSGKNRMVHRTLELPAGRYAAYFVTDGSHSPAYWNTLPPRDPYFWGLTLWVADPQQRRYVRRTEYRHLPDDKLIVSLTRLRDDEHRKQGLTLKKPLEVRIFAVGEGLHGRMVDYGWIVDARTGERIWTMDYKRTTHAGGGSKNRQIDEVIHLDRGSYYVVFVTDGSHSYRDWNVRPPEHPERWGISLFAVEEDFDRSAVGRSVDLDELGELARIDRVGDDENRQRPFRLERPARILICAVGEGTGQTMYDYGWITERRTGKVVWKMTYAETRHAGGGSKNRLFQGSLELPDGEYVLHYRTDGSHSYRNWNSAPPFDPEGWGIRIALE